jgi:hypothetical protein
MGFGNLVHSYSLVVEYKSLDFVGVVGLDTYLEDLDLKIRLGHLSFHNFVKFIGLKIF